MTDLSPAAAAVRAAYSEGCYLLMPHRKHQLDGMACPGLAAALRAVADQVQMKEPFGDTDADAGVFAAHQAIHTYLLTIAAELER